MAQEYLGRRIHTRLFQKIPLFYLLAGLGGANTKDGFQIGRPGVAEVFAGVAIDRPMKEVLGGFNSYQPEIQIQKNDSSKVMGARDTMPTVANPTTQSQDQELGTAEFRWTRITTPLLVWHESLDRAMNSAGTGVDKQDLAAKNVLINATESATNVHYTNWAQRFWSGSPTNQDADPWDNCSGILEAINDQNVYGRVDRSNPSNSTWQGHVIATPQAADVAQIIDNANYNQGLSVYGNGVNVLLTNTTLYQTFKAQVRARGGVVMLNGLPDIGAFGMKREILQYDNAFITWDPMCPANTVAALNLEYWKIIIHPKKNFLIDAFVDISRNSEGAKDALQSFIDTRLILACDEPGGQALYTNVS